MKFQVENLNRSTGDGKPSEISKKESFPRRKFSSRVLKAAALGALAIASYMGYDKFSRGMDYTEAGTFNEAFKNARKDNKKGFKWQGKKFSTNFIYKFPVDYTQTGSFNEAFRKAFTERKAIFRWNGKDFNTSLVDEEFSKNYWESKKFLEDYYSSDYFKSKHKPNDYEISQIKHQIFEGVLNNPRYQELLQKKNLPKSLTPKEKEELKKYENVINNFDSIKTSQEFQNEVSDFEEKTSNEIISNLKARTYFSITHHKSKEQAEEESSDGFYNRETKQVFIYGKTSNLDDETTSTHELTHKSRGLNSGLSFDLYLEIREVALGAATRNLKFLTKYGEKTSEYLCRPTEVDARQNASRFWLFKHFPGYKADTVFTSEHFLFLQKNYDKLPYDIKQLIDLFPHAQEFITNMNKW